MGISLTYYSIQSDTHDNSSDTVVLFYISTTQGDYSISSKRDFRNNEKPRLNAYSQNNKRLLSIIRVTFCGYFINTRPR